jgi:hypothetical protein
MDPRPATHLPNSLARECRLKGVAIQQDTYSDFILSERNPLCSYQAQYTYLWEYRPAPLPMRPWLVLEQKECAQLRIVGIDQIQTMNFRRFQF